MGDIAADGRLVAGYPVWRVECADSQVGFQSRSPWGQLPIAGRFDALGVTDDERA
jgi:hypothetical protein